MFSAKTGKLLGKWNLHAGRICSIASSGDVLASGDMDGRVKVWRLPVNMPGVSSGNPLRTPERPEDEKP